MLSMRIKVTQGMGQGCPSRVNFNFAWKRNSIRTSCSIVINLALTRFGMLGRTWWHPLTKDKLDRLFYKLQALFYKLNLIEQFLQPWSMPVKGTMAPFMTTGEI